MARSSSSMAGTTVLVTGATNGIGKATATGLASRGSCVAIVGRDKDRAESVAREIIVNGGLAEVFVADLASLAAVRRLADEVLVRLPRLEVLINNVGGYWRSRHVTVDGIERPAAFGPTGWISKQDGIWTDHASAGLSDRPLLIGPQRLRQLSMYVPVMRAPDRHFDGARTGVPRRVLWDFLRHTSPNERTQSEF